MSPRPLSPPPHAGFVHLAPTSGSFTSLPSSISFTSSNPAQPDNITPPANLSLSIACAHFPSPRGVYPPTFLLLVTRHSPLLLYPLSFHTLAHSFVTLKMLSPILFNVFRTLCTKTPRGVGHIFLPGSSTFKPSNLRSCQRLFAPLVTRHCLTIPRARSSQDRSSRCAGWAARWRATSPAE